MLARGGDIKARELAGKIEDTDRRVQVSGYVDFQLVRAAIESKDPQQVLRLAKSSGLTHLQRSWSYTQTARLLKEADRDRALEILKDAVQEARRIENDRPDRVFALLAAARQLLNADRVRAWEIFAEAVKSSNSADEFTGDSAHLIFSVATKSGVKMTSIGGEEFGLTAVLKTLAKDDLYRSVELAKSFEHDAPRASATLAIARAVLER